MLSRSLVVLSSLTTFAVAREIPVADVAAFDLAVKRAQPGDVLVLKEGEWRDAKLVFKAAGTETAPITLRAAIPGKTIFSGQTQLRIGGEYLVVEGLNFHDFDAAADVIELRANPKHPSHHCRLTNCAVEVEKGQVDKTAQESHWVNLYGSDNRVDHCRIQGKLNPGTTLVVWLGEGNEGRHQIDHNYFGPRERLGVNGGETIRVGTSAYSMQTAGCVIEHNLFERCDGEVECISNKSCGNIYRENTFLNTKGTLTLRHGNGCTVERNVFTGMAGGASKKGGGGVRIIGEDHVIRGNCFDGLTGDGVRSSICLMMGIPNSPDNGYFQVKRARIEDNVFMNCEHPILIGFSEKPGTTLPPIDIVFAGNRIAGAKGAAVEARCSTDGIRWEKNEFFGKELGIPPTKGIEWKSVPVTALKPLQRSEVGTSW